MSAKLSQLVTVINSSTSTYEDFLKVVKKSDYTRDIVYFSRNWNRKLKLPYIITEAMLKFVDNSRYKGNYSAHHLKYKDIDYLYKNNDYLKEKIKMLDHVLQKVNPNEGKIGYENHSIFYFIVNAFPVSIIDKFIKSGLDYKVKDKYNNNVIQYVLNREKKYSTELFKYLINLPDIDINHINSSGNSMLSLICSHELYDKKEYREHNSKYINMFNILIRHPNIDINAGVPLLELIDQEHKTSILTKNFYYFDILSKRSDLDINKRKIKKFKIGWNYYEVQTDFFYYLINLEYERKSEEFQKMYNWCLNNNKIDVNHVYSTDDYEKTLLSSMVTKYVKVLYEDSESYAKIELNRIKKYLEIKKPKITKDDIQYMRSELGLKEVISLRNIVKKSNASSMSQILDSIEA